MDIANSTERNLNNLELYLNDVYDKECVFKIEKEEVDFIQTGIEVLVQELVDKVREDDAFDVDFCDSIDNDNCLKLIKEKALAEVNFPLKGDNFVQDYCKVNGKLVKIVKSTIIKVGSFYDGTKNNFPDEFDFVFPLFGVRLPLSIHTNALPLYLEQAICKHVKYLYNYTYTSDIYQITRELKFNKYICKHGPAFKLQFIFNNGCGEQRSIHVDLVPAYKIVDSNSEQWFMEKVVEHVKPKAFRKEILASNRSLIVEEHLAFTETEQQFIKNVLSKRHLKVFRILKYLLNGHSDGEKLEEQFFREPYYTSYRIKIMIIFHHETCTNEDAENFGPCVLQVLEEVSKYETVDKFPKFTEFYVSGKQLNVLPFLKSTKKRLETMKMSEDTYCYEKHKMKSVSGQFLDIGIRRNKSRYSIYADYVRNWCTFL